MTQLRIANFRIKGPLSHGRRFLAFIFISLTAFVVIYSFWIPFSEYYDAETYNPIAGLLVAIFPLIAGITIGTRNSVHVDRQDKRIYQIKSVFGWIYKKSFVTYKSLNYVSIFQNYTGYYECRLFYNGDQRINLFEIKHEQKARGRVQRIGNGLSIPIHDMIYDDYWEDKEAPFIDHHEREIGIHLSEGELSLWQRVFGAIFFTASLFLIYYFISVTIRNGYEYVKGSESILTLAVLLGGLGLTLTVIKDYDFDFKNMHYRLIHRVGPLEFGKWRQIRQFEYISLHQKRLGEYHINLWYNRSKHFTLGIYGNYNPALVVAKQLALRFHIDILNSGDPSGKKWIRHQELLEDALVPKGILPEDT